MKIIPCTQGSEAWHAARLGIPTASCFDKIITPSGKPSSSAAGYMHRLIAERLLGHPVDGGDTSWMERGKITEAEAVALYELHRDVDTQPAGFCVTDDGRAGCSPDRLVGNAGGLELKCPSAAVHVGYLLEVEPRKFWPQIQGNLWVTERGWWDFLSYCPQLPHALARFDRDQEFIDALAREVEAFCDRLDAEHQKLAALIGEQAA